MSRPEILVAITPEEYLAGEQRTDVKHEYVAGHVYAMVGASVAHNRIALNFASRLMSHLRGGPCRVFISDIKVRIRPAEVFYYPDVAVTCRPEDHDPSAYHVNHPKLIVEVLSPSTERLDREEKRERYQLLDSLEEYVLVSQEPRQVQVYRRSAEGWDLESFTAREILILRSVDLEFPLAELYLDV